MRIWHYLLAFGVSVCLASPCLGQSPAKLDGNLTIEEHSLGYLIYPGDLTNVAVIYDYYPEIGFSVHENGKGISFTGRPGKYTVKARKITVKNNVPEVETVRTKVTIVKEGDVPPVDPDKPQPEPDKPDVPPAPTLPDGRFKLAATSFNLAAEVKTSSTLTAAKRAELFKAVAANFNNVAGLLKADPTTNPDALGEIKPAMAKLRDLNVASFGDAATRKSFEPWTTGVADALKKLIEAKQITNVKTDLPAALEEIATGAAAVK